MGYRRGNNWSGDWPGRGPFSYLPPWQRPGWLYGRGTCYYLYGAPNPQVPALQPKDETALLKQQKGQIETQIAAMQDALKKIQDRLDQLKE